MPIETFHCPSSHAIKLAPAHRRNYPSAYENKAAVRQAIIFPLGAVPKPGAQQVD